jgi:chromosome segregation protein
LDLARPEYDTAISVLEQAQIKRDETRSLANDSRDKLSDLRTSEQTASDELADTRRMLDRMASQIDLLEKDRSATELQQQQISALATEAAVGIEELQKALDAQQQLVDTSNSALDRAHEERQFLEMELEEAQTYLRSLQSRREAVIAQIHLLESVIASYDDFSESVQFLASTEKDWSRSGMQTVSDVISCPSEYRLALDNALKDYAACIVVSDTEELHAAIASLSEQNKGRASFIVLDQLKNINPDAESIATPLHRVIHLLDEKYRSLASTILAGYFIAESNEVAEQLARSSDYGRYFVPSGAWYDSRGIIHSGSAHGQPSSIMGRLDRRRQLDQARKDLGGLVKQISDQDSSVQKTVAKLEEDICGKLEQILKDEMQVLRQAENNLNRSRYERETIQQRQEELSLKHDDLNVTLKKLKDDIVSTRDSVGVAETALVELRANRIDAEENFHSLETDSRVALNQFSDASVEAVEARNRFENLEKDIARIDDALADLADRAQKRIVERESITLQIKEGEILLEAIEESLSVTKEKRPALEEAVSNARDSVVEVKVSISDLESELRDIRRSKEQQMREESSRAVKLAEVKTRLEDLILHVDEDYGLAVTEIDEELDSETDEQTARARVKTLRQQVRSIGPVNELALE